MKQKFFDDEEKALAQSLEKDEWKSVKNLKREIKKHQQIARRTLVKDKRVNIRISSKDLESLQVRAVEEGIPYQTFMASILHKYVSGRLVESKPSS